MHNNNTAATLAALIDELAVVSEHATISLCGDDTAIVTAWVSPSHTGPDVKTDTGASSPHISSPRQFDARLPLTAALDDVLAKIALAAPQAIPA